MATLRIENAIRDFDAWHTAFDKFDRFRAAQGVQAYRVTRSLTQPDKVIIDLDFASLARAEAFIPQLARIWGTPQSSQQLSGHSTPELYELVASRSYVRVPGSQQPT